MDRIKIQNNLAEYINRDYVFNILKNYADTTIRIETEYKINFYKEIYVEINIRLSFTVVINDEYVQHVILRKRTINEDSDCLKDCELIKDELMNIIYDIDKIKKYIDSHREAQEDMHSLMNRLTQKAF